MKLIKRIACLVLTLACMHLLFAQFLAEEQAQIDSLSLFVKSKSLHNTSMASAYACLSETLAFSHLDTVIYLCTKAQHISKKNLASHSNKQTNSLVVKTTSEEKNS